MLSTRQVVRHGLLQRLPNRRAVLGVGVGALALGLSGPMSSAIGLRSMTAGYGSSHVMHLGKRFSSSFPGLFNLGIDLSSPMAQLSPPQSPPKWTHTAEEISSLTKQAIETNRALQDNIAKLSPEECTFESVCHMA